MVALLNRCPASGLAEKSQPITWLWEGVLARGAVTLFTSRWKAGKTTLISLLLSRLTNGGELAGASVAAGSAVVISEEANSLWDDRHKLLQFSDHIEFSCRPFAVRPTQEQWEQMIDELAATKPGLVVIDTLGVFLPGNCENHPVLLNNALMPLRKLTDLGCAVLLVHHPCKGHGEMSPRGSGALTAFVDLIADFEIPAAAANDRIRRLKVVSKLSGHQKTATQMWLIELSADGREYRRLPLELGVDTFEVGWPILKLVLEDAENRLTRQLILKYWPPDFDKPSMATLRRWLVRAEQEGLIEKRGTGRYHDAFTYALKGKKFEMDRFERLPPLPPLQPMPGRVLPTFRN